MPLKTSHTDAFRAILQIIQDGRAKAYRAVNHELVETYGRIGAFLAQQVNEKGWGKAIVQDLASWLAQKAPELKGYSAQNLWRMKQFHEVYANNSKLSPLVRELDWTKNCIIMAQCKSIEEQEFYLKSSIHFHWSKRELEAQIQKGSFERTLLADSKLSPTVRVLPQEVIGVFKDSYLLDFLDLPESHLEKDLQSALVANLRRFLLELGGGFTYVGEKIRIEVGRRDFELDLLFYHRDLQCLVAFELKTGPFEPAHVGQLSFYLEALDRSHKRAHENPSIGVLLCRSKDDDVVELALSRSLSPALVAEYETKMIPRELLKQKLHEWGEMLEHRGNHAE